MCRGRGELTRETTLPCAWYLKKRYVACPSSAEAAAFQRGKLCGPARVFADSKQFAKLLRPLASAALGGLRQSPFRRPAASAALSRPLYASRRYFEPPLIAYDAERVSFQRKDYAHGSAQKVMTLAATEFLRRFFLQVLPKGFVRIRHFGFLANRFRTPSLTLCRQLLAVSPPLVTIPCNQTATWHCPRCGARMHLRQALTAVELLWRCPAIDSS